MPSSASLSASDPVVKRVTAKDGHEITVRLWPTAAVPCGVIHWLHGMAEHSGRYASLAAALNAGGWHVCVHDHRGHGESVSANCPQGHFADLGGWQSVLGDISCVQHWLREQYPALPHVLGGHSMGSFTALAWAEQHASDQDTSLAGLILCGSDYSPGWFYRLARLPILFERRRRGPRGTSPLIRGMTFDAWARTLKARHTDFDWLSRDSDEVSAYIKDPACGFDCTTQLWCDLMGGLIRAHAPANLRRLPAALPILLIAGDSDPMSRHGKGMQGLYKALQRTGSAVIRFTEFPGARHEILNDYCRAEVHATLRGWLDDVIAAPAN
ncbi:lysophospholipase [Alcanivorax sp. JB21]|uniref:alpha/beta fold hydrolase n=1 Tax=Alcanivorax limicola TaxID=2874102 RepID=UPI001CC099A4|nr:alpha/beta fold hydrolase [Alcanivorax limicola]MBZ2187608.1 lysophospholipase [Alcanivorax limicola]